MRAFLAPRANQLSRVSFHPRLPDMWRNMSRALSVAFTEEFSLRLEEVSDFSDIGGSMLLNMETRTKRMERLGAIARRVAGKLIAAREFTSDAKEHRSATVSGDAWQAGECWAQADAILGIGGAPARSRVERDTPCNRPTGAEGLQPAPVGAGGNGVGPAAFWLDRRPYVGDSDCYVRQRDDRTIQQRSRLEIGIAASPGRAASGTQAPHALPLAVSPNE
jgi:hypothetical protein